MRLIHQAEGYNADDTPEMKAGRKMAETSNNTDVIQLLITDHRAVDEAFEQLESMSADDDNRGPLAWHIVAELARHSVAEEQQVYPPVRKYMDDGDSLADHHLHEHSEAEQLMRQLEQQSPASDAFSETVSSLASTIRHHVEDEENDLFPQMREELSASTLQELGTQVEQAKEKAPLRPHPFATEQPAAERVLGPGAGLVDRVREALS